MSHICKTCGREFSTGQALGGHRGTHSHKKDRINHGSVRGYLKEARRAGPVHAVGGRKARQKVRHCKPCRDAWNSYWRVYRAERALIKAQQKLINVKRKAV